MTEHGEDPIDNLQTMGILNALKTGNMHLDLIIAMCIPLILRFLFTNMESLGDTVFSRQFWIRWFERQSGYNERFLVSKSIIETGGYYGSSQQSIDHDTQNAVLIKAIKLFVHSKCTLKLEAANLDLTSTSADSAAKSDNNNTSGYFSDDDDAKDGPKTVVQMLSEYTLVKRPLSNQWHEVGFYGKEKPLHKVELQILENEDTVGSKDTERQRSTLTYHLRSRGAASIDDFVEQAYHWYLDELRKLEDNARHYYELQKVKSDDEGGAANYKRFKLSDEKTFDSLFFKQKDSLLNIVNHFVEKTGKYSIKGYPHKLGLLLYGPPGTGKTSLIKALAQYTGRSIVNVPLSKITTNTELQSVFFDNRYYLQGEYVPVKLGFKDVIFVLEDVDSASNVVKRRDGKLTSEVVEVENIAIPPPKSIFQMLLESSDSDCQELVSTLIENSKRLKVEATKPETLKSLASGMAALPGLSLVGSQESVLAKLGSEALEMAENLSSGQESVDRFLAMRVKPLKALIEKGAEVDDSLVDELLSIPGRGHMAVREASREIAYDNVDDEHAILPESLRSGGNTATESVMGPSFPVDETRGNGGNEKGDADKAKKWSSLDFLQKDRLNLTGLLNVLDGVVDTPGRMLIMTTNHPELLDPALIRPGRIDKKILLGYMACSDIIKMLEHYFMAKLDNSQRLRVDDVINGNPSLGRPQLNLTPAQVEQLAAEHDELDDMIAALEEKGRSRMHLEPSPNNRTSSHSKITYGV